MGNFLGSFSILIFLFIGLLVGRTVFPKKWLRFNSLLQTAGIALTIFAMGVSLGGSPTFIADVTTAGWQAFLFGLATVTGSVVVVYLFTRIFLKNNTEEKKK